MVTIRFTGKPPGIFTECSFKCFVEKDTCFIRIACLVFLIKDKNGSPVCVITCYGVRNSYHVILISSFGSLGYGDVETFVDDRKFIYGSHITVFFRNDCREKDF